MSEINKRIEALEAELQKLKNEVKEPKIENGKWYKNYDYFLVYITDINKGVGYGFGSSGQWYNESNDWGFKDVRPATHQEVEEALQKQYEKLGGKCKLDFCHYWNVNSCGFGCIYSSKGDKVFRKGVWAEIVKDEPIKIGGYEVVKDGSDYKIGCRTVQKSNVQYFKDFMISKNFKKISFDGVETDVETLIKILSI